MKKLLILSFVCLSLAAGIAAEISFAKGKWDPSQWLLVKSPRWPNKGSWVQQEDHIANAVPADATPIQWQSARCAETYTSMLMKAPVRGNFQISSVMEFTNSMAPLLVLAAPPGKAADGYPEYREHWEVVLWDQGINIWHHQFKDGKPLWHLAASAKHKFLPHEKYELRVSVRRTKSGAQINVVCDEVSFNYMEHALPETLQVGLTGCEGLNRFYDFKVVQAGQK